MLMPCRRALVFAFVAAALSACSPPPPHPDGGDAGGDAATDGSPDGAACAEAVPIHSLYPGPLYVRVGAASPLRLRLRRDRNVCPADYALTSENPAVLTAPATVHMDLHHGWTEFMVTAGAMPGRTRLRVSQAQPATTDTNAQAAIDVVVLPADPPACPPATAAATGRLAAGMRVAGAAGSPLEAASVSAPMPATEVTPQDVTIGCAADQVPDGYDAVGPAIAFGPAHARMPRELPFTVPANLARVPAMYELHTEIAYTGPGVRTPRIVPLANTRFTTDGKAVSFMATRLGTYQAVVRRGIGTHQVPRHFAYHHILGLSMGAMGTSAVGTHHPERFDGLLPLGGPVDAGVSGFTLREFVFGGFCTAAQRATLGDAACNMGSSLARVPMFSDLGFVPQHFEFFNTPPGGGTGGSFDRAARFRGMRDIARAFGNPINDADPATHLLPPGVPASELTRSDTDRCATPVVLGGGADRRYYSAEYNPSGTYPVITFCDGSHTMNGSEWSGMAGTVPVELALAVDLNRNGLRDRGEPVVVNFAERFRDWGTDGVASAMEPGYDAVTNRDPAGDDYDRQYNPGGTEGNFLYDMGEPYDDFGVDGVRCPAGQTCPYDIGEGNGRFDPPEGAAGMNNMNPRGLVAAMPQSEVHRLGLWVDGGIRDALMFGVNANHFSGVIAQRGESLHVFNNYSALITGRDPPATNDDGFVFSDVDYEHLPQHVMMRYGFVDASPTQIANGDGAHVGDAMSPQVEARIRASVWWAGSRWPDGDRRIEPAPNPLNDDAGRCANGYTCTFDFTSMRASRTAPVVIYLPPGYHRAENATQRYPVLYMLHGYGMDAMGLSLSGVLFRTFMMDANTADWQRLPKMIVVFVDGRCRDGDGCLEGTFYTDSPTGVAKVETYMLELDDWLSATFRVRQPGDAMVTE